MGNEYHVLPEQTVGSHMVSGFAARRDGTVRVLLYSHDAMDTESRSEAGFEVTLNLAGLKGKKVGLTEYRFDKDHNSYFRLGRALRDRVAAGRPAPETAAKIQEALRGLESDRRAAQLAALEQLARLGPAAASAAQPLLFFIQKVKDEEVRAKALVAFKRVSAPRPCSAADMKKIEEQAALRPTGSAPHAVGADGRLTIKVKVAGNGANFLIWTPEGASPNRRP
jgi:hypothetical protein